MTPEKAARISSYLVRNSARNSMMNRNKKQKDDAEHRLPDRSRIKTEPVKQAGRMPGLFRIKGGCGSLIPFIVIVLVILFAVRLSM